MKKYILLTLLAWSFLSAFLAQAQTVALSLVNPTIVGNKFQITLRAASVGGNFGIGTNTLKFNYPTALLSSPTIFAENFPSPAFGATNISSNNSVTGAISINTNLASTTAANSNALPITSAGVNLIVMQFTIISTTASANLSWGTGSQQSSVLDDDKVSILAISSMANITKVSLTGALSAGNDQTVNCTTPTAYLYASGGSGTYTWSTGETTANIAVTPTITTTYKVTATNGQIDDIIVVANKTPPTANAGADVTITCAAPTTTLIGSGTGTGLTYLWNTSETSTSITVSPSLSTTYTLTTKNTDGCTATDRRYYQ
jgi:hypothetical protein